MGVNKKNITFLIILTMHVALIIVNKRYFGCLFSIAVYIIRLLDNHKKKLGMKLSRAVYIKTSLKEVDLSAKQCHFSHKQVYKTV